MSMGALTANLVTSSRIFAGRRVEDVDEHTAMLFESAAIMLQQAGGGLANLTQVTAFIGGPAFRQNVATAWERVVSGRENPPVLHVLEADLGGNGAPRIEILGLL
jgi:hypothetical protein